ncbi:MAG: hypothetical protein Q7J55_06205 [bacterium]|nr:hypothetical protein [bacterium]
MSVNKDYEGFFECLNLHEVKYLIVGAYAVAYYTRPRFTKDIDILIETSVENAKKAVAALKDFGFGDIGVSLEDLCDPNTIIQLGIAPNRIDIMCSIEGVEFDNIWQNRVKGKYGNQNVFFISLDNLMKTKRAVGREQDKLDLKYLEKLK